MSETTEIVVIEQPKKVNRAGMVCFNLAGQVLLVKALANKEQWVFPKGHIEKDEETFQTAERETKEECGVIASTVGDSIGITSYKHLGEDVVIEWFSGLATRRVPENTEKFSIESEWRESKWFHWNKALEVLAFKDMKDLLKAALCFKE